MSRSRGQDVNFSAVKRSRSRLRCGQAVNQQKRWSKFFDPGRSYDYSANGSDHPLIGVPCAFVTALLLAIGILGTQQVEGNGELEVSTVKSVPLRQRFCTVTGGVGGGG